MGGRLVGSELLEESAPGEHCRNDGPDRQYTALTTTIRDWRRSAHATRQGRSR
jgi:hypothetical protein